MLVKGQERSHCQRADSGRHSWHNVALVISTPVPASWTPCLPLMKLVKSLAVLLLFFETNIIVGIDQSYCHSALLIRNVTPVCLGSNSLHSKDVCGTLSPQRSLFHNSLHLLVFVWVGTRTVKAQKDEGDAGEKWWLRSHTRCMYPPQVKDTNIKNMPRGPCERQKKEMSFGCFFYVKSCAYLETLESYYCLFEANSFDFEKWTKSFKILKKKF